MISLHFMASARGGLPPRHQGTKDYSKEIIISACESSWQFSGLSGLYEGARIKGVFEEHDRIKGNPSQQQGSKYDEKGPAAVECGPAVGHFFTQRQAFFKFSITYLCGIDD